MSRSVAAIVINYNGIEETRECVRSVLATAYPALSVCVVDNGSEVDEAALLGREFPTITSLRNDENRGYSAAANHGVAWALEAGCDYICLLNNDTDVAPDFFDALVAARIAWAKPAILAPLILFPDGRVWSAGGTIRWPNVAGEHVGIGEDPARYVAPRTTGWASGCSWFFTPEDYARVGPLDESFFLYLEDVDWCLRAKRRGVDVVLTPAAKLTHGVSKTVGRFDPRIPRYYAYRNFYIVGFRHGTAFWRFVMAGHLTFTLSKIAARNLLSPAHRRDSLYNARTRGLWDFLRGRRGKAPYHHGIHSATRSGSRV